MLSSIRGEFERYRALLGLALEQVDDADLHRAMADDGNSIAVVVQHLAGNLASRFTDFLDTDGEKPWRERDREFEPVDGERDALLRRMDASWGVLHAALDDVERRDALDATVSIRGIELTVTEALHRSLAHAAYHVGQVVLMARTYRGDLWTTLSVPRGGSSAYAANPTKEKHPGGTE